MSLRGDASKCDLYAHHHSHPIFDIMSTHKVSLTPFTEAGAGFLHFEDNVHMAVGPMCWGASLKEEESLRDIWNYR